MNKGKGGFFQASAASRLDLLLDFALDDLRSGGGLRWNGIGGFVIRRFHAFLEAFNRTAQIFTNVT